MKISMSNYERAKQQPMQIEQKTVVRVIKKLKRKKAGDDEGWTNEMIKEGGKEMIKSITHMFNRISREEILPKQWTQMKIKSIHKKGSKVKMENRRGLFLTNVLSKVYERVIDDMTGTTIRINEHQCGGKKGRSTADNIIMMKSVIDNNARLNKHTKQHKLNIHLFC